MKLWGVNADDVREVREIVQHLFINIVKPACIMRDSQQAKTHVDQLLFQFVDDMHSTWDVDSFLDQAQELVKKAIDEHADYNTAELDRSRPVKKAAATRRRLIEQVAVNMHTMGTSFVGKVRDVRQSGQHEPEFESAGWWQKPTHGARCKQCEQCGVVKEFGKDFHKMQLGRGGKCLAYKGGSRTTSQTPHQPLIGMIFTNANPRYAGRLNDKQGGDTIMTMERVTEAIAFNAELTDKLTGLWPTSEQMGFFLKPTGGGDHEERAEDLESSQRVRDHLVAYHLAPAITDFISDEIGNAEKTNLNRH